MFLVNNLPIKMIESYSSNRLILQYIGGDAVASSEPLG